MKISPMVRPLGPSNIIRMHTRVGSRYNLTQSPSKVVSAIWVQVSCL